MKGILIKVPMSLKTFLWKRERLREGEREREREEKRREKRERERDLLPRASYVAIVVYVAN